MWLAGYQQTGSPALTLRHLKKCVSKSDLVLRTCRHLVTIPEFCGLQFSVWLDRELSGCAKLTVEGTGCTGRPPGLVWMASLYPEAVRL